MVPYKLEHSESSQILYWVLDIKLKLIYFKIMKSRPQLPYKIIIKYRRLQIPGFRNSGFRITEKGRRGQTRALAHVNPIDHALMFVHEN